MNTLQKIVVVIGLAGIALASLFPPWAVRCVYRMFNPPLVIQEVIYGFLFDPPTGVPRLSTEVNMLCEISLDVPALLTVYIVIIAITFGLALLFGLRRSP